MPDAASCALYISKNGAVKSSPIMAQKASSAAPVCSGSSEKVVRVAGRRSLLEKIEASSVM